MLSYANLLRAQAFNRIPGVLRLSLCPIQMMNLTEEILTARTKTFVWLGANMCEGAPPRHARQDHLFIRGPPKTGKSSLFRMLSTCVRFWTPPGENFFDNYDDDYYDAALFDEVRPGFDGISQSTLHKFMDGDEVSLRVKCRSPIQKRKNLPCVFISNFSLHELFSTNLVDRVAFETRVTTVEFNAAVDSVFFDSKNPWCQMTQSSSSNAN